LLLPGRSKKRAIKSKGQIPPRAGNARSTRPFFKQANQQNPPVLFFQSPFGGWGGFATGANPVVSQKTNTADSQKNNLLTGISSLLSL
jgi:hypothetical protein